MGSEEFRLHLRESLSATLVPALQFRHTFLYIVLCSLLKHVAF